MVRLRSGKGRRRCAPVWVMCVVMAVAGALLPAASGWSKPHHAAPAKTHAAAVEKPAVSPSGQKLSAEAMLIEVYIALAGDHLRDALARSETLVRTYPTFRLGQLIHGDLLLMQTHSVLTLGPANGPPEALQNLRDEAAVRLRSLRNRPDPDMVPRAVLQLREDQKHVLIVDAKSSRLYVYENQGGALRFQTDFYISQGRLGTNKSAAGDQKTPIGVYYITSHVSGPRLPEFYGAGALPINYPNEWDRLNGRSGSGIWLHGTPPDTYSRPPRASDGCVVLTNADLSRLMGSVEIGKTPVVIADSIEYVNKAKSISDRALATKLVDDWRRDVESLNPKRYLANYSRQFKTEAGEDRDSWFAKQWTAFTGVTLASVKLREVTLFLYPGRDDLMVGTFTQDAQLGKTRNSTRKRQYWAREGAQWKIISETVL
jgi:L,D-peptidoglycan transpeptidase YkuD (ErfK/YbiS/YcfS/YnhG family)